MKKTCVVSTVHASSTVTPSHRHTDQARSLPESSQPRQPSVQRRRAEPHYNKDTTRTSGDTRRPPPGVPVSRRNWWTAEDARPAAEGEGEWGRGGATARVRDRWTLFCELLSAVRACRVRSQILLHRHIRQWQPQRHWLESNCSPWLLLYMSGASRRLLLAICEYSVAALYLRWQQL